MASNPATVKASKRFRFWGKARAKAKHTVRPSPARGSSKLGRTLVTPEGVSLNITLASASGRLGALIIDMLLILAIVIGYILLLLLLEQIFDLKAFRGSFGEFFQVISIIFLFFLRNGYFLALELGPRGATWGKRITGMRVAARDGGRLTAEAIIARNLLREVEFFLPVQFLVVLLVQGNSSSFTLLAGSIWVLVFAFFLLFNRDRLRCGDLLAGTWVVETPREQLSDVVAPTDSMAAASRGGGDYRFSDAELSIYGEYELQSLEEVLRGGSEDSQRTVYVAICQKLGWKPGAGDERAFLENYYTQLRQKLESNMRFGKRRADKFDGSES